MILRLADPMLVPSGVRIVAQFGRIVTCRLRRRDIPAVRAQSASVKAARLYSYDHPDLAGESVHEPGPSDQRRPDGDLPTSDGVVVAHVDWGIDFAHPDFRLADGRTRLLALWDQSCAVDPRRPNRYGYGRIHQAVDIDRALATPDPYGALGYHPADSDTGRGSHGTHTTSISTGNGRSGGPVGLAPEAHIVFVHLSTAVTQEGPALLGDSVAFLEALDFIARTAGERPVVINASIGRQAGEHDGKTLTEQGMDAFLLAAPNRAIVQSTGNYFDRAAHASGMLRPGGQRTLRFSVAVGAALPTEVDLWYPGVDRFGISLHGPDGVPEVRAAPEDRAVVLAEGREIGRLYHRIGDPNNGDNEVTLFLEPVAPAGDWELTLSGVAVADGRFHAWVERTAAKPGQRSRFHPDDVDQTATLGTICNGLRTLAVGAYDAHSPERPLAGFSSAGPCRDGRLKPDLVAPGVRVLGARSRPRATAVEAPPVTQMSGSSMAAPHVAGAVALMLAAAQRPLTIDEIRRLLLANVDPVPTDADQIDRLRLGGGFLNTVAAVDAARSAGRRLATPARVWMGITPAPSTEQVVAVARPGAAAAPASSDAELITIEHQGPVETGPNEREASEGAAHFFVTPESNSKTVPAAAESSGDEAELTPYGSAGSEAPVQSSLDSEITAAQASDLVDAETYEGGASSTNPTLRVSMETGAESVTTAARSPDNEAEHATDAVPPSETVLPVSADGDVITAREADLGAAEASDQILGPPPESNTETVPTITAPAAKNAEQPADRGASSEAGPEASRESETRMPPQEGFTEAGVSEGKAPGDPSVRFDRETDPEIMTVAIDRSEDEAEKTVHETTGQEAAIEASREDEMSTAQDESFMEVSEDETDASESNSIFRVTWEADPETELADDSESESDAEAVRDGVSRTQPFAAIRPDPFNPYTSPRLGPELPFQFQIPITGGPPALALPIGGAASPFAVTLPLGSTAAPPGPATSTTAAAPTATPVAEPPPVTVAASDLPLYVAPSAGDTIQEAMETPGVAQETELQAWETAVFTSANAPVEATPAPPESNETELETEAGSQTAAAELEWVEGEGADQGFGQRVLAAAEALGRSSAVHQHSSSAVLRSLSESLRESEGEAESARNFYPGVLAGNGPPPSATALFHALTDPQRVTRRLGTSRADFADGFLVLARPAEPLGNVLPMPGDLVLRIARGQGWGHVAIVASTGVRLREGLAEAGLRGEGYPLLLPGGYVHVVEPWPRVRAIDDRFARRLTDPAGLVLPDTLLLRIARSSGETGEADQSGAEPSFATQSPGEVPTLRKGVSGDAVRRAQQALNRIHADAVALALPGLPGCPLPEDGRFDTRTETAVIALQQQVFDDPSKWDGVIGRETWTHLNLLNAPPASQRALPDGRSGQIASRLRRSVQSREAAEGAADDLSVATSSAPTVAPVPAPQVVASGAVDEGREVVATVPLLRSHRGTAPDLVLRWNRMGALPNVVDVVVHLHGFSGNGAAMRVDAEKEPVSGLDFTNPDAPGEPGRSEPTLCVLPRGNFYGGRTGKGYDFPALVTAEGLRQLIDFALARFAARIGAPQVGARRLLLTAHSGGGAPLMRILGNYDPDEVQVFDALYSDAAPLVRWATARLRRADSTTSSLRVLYIAGTGTVYQSRVVHQAIQALVPAGDPRASRFRVEATRVVHGDIPRRFGWRLLRDAGSDLPLAGGHPIPPQPVPPPPVPPQPTPSVPTGILTQGDVDRLAAITFGNAAEINGFFAQGGLSGFADWFNANLGGRGPFVRSGGGGGMRMPSAPDARARFNGFWDCIQLAYDRPRISALEFATLMCITLNETDGDFASRAESSGRNQGGRTDAHGRHPGLAYFFDRILLRAPDGWKASYNRLSGGRTAGSLFNDEVFIRSHGALGGAAALARHGDDFEGAWNSEYYPQDRFSTDERAAETEFIRQADFYKFRGRGVIQTTGRGGYTPFVRFVQSYSGADATLVEKRQRWAGLSADEAATASSNEDWDVIFNSLEALARALALHSGSGASDYRIMSTDVGVLTNVPPPPPPGRRRSTGRRGSVYLMGRRISGNPGYAAGIYRDRVFALLRGIGQVAAGAPVPSRLQPVPSPPPHRQGPVSPPNPATTQEQWDAHPRAHGWFGNTFARYAELAPLYAAKGISDAAAYLDDNMVSLRFFGHRQDGHRDLIVPLRRAEDAMRRQTVSPPITSFGCLVPRPIRGTTNRLSNHAAGRAFDLNPVGNPRITQAADYLVIGAVIGADIRGETSPAALSRASRAFQDGFTQSWIASQTRADIIAALHDAHTRERLDGYARTGFCTLYLPLIEELIAAGLGWGGAYHTSKDFMHFELP